MTVRNPYTLKSRCPEGGHPLTRARLVDQDGTVLVSDATVTDGAVNVYDEQSATPGTAVFTDAAIDMAAAMAALSVTGWDEDSTGYTFEHKITDVNVCAEGGHTYRIEYKLTTSTDDDLIWIIHRVECVSVTAG